MFGLSFSELMLIGVVALIVIGPERLPKVARTVGHLLGRAQRYVNDVKTDIRKEMDATDIGNLKDQMQEAANSVKASVEETGKTWRAPIDEAQEALKQASESVKTLADSARNMRDEAAKTDQAETGAPSAPVAATAGDADSTARTSLTPADTAQPGALPADTPEQDMQSSETVDTRTLPLPGFEQKRAPESIPADSPRAHKGSQP